MTFVHVFAVLSSMNMANAEPDFLVSQFTEHCWNIETWLKLARTCVFSVFRAGSSPRSHLKENPTTSFVDVMDSLSIWDSGQGDVTRVITPRMVAKLWGAFMPGIRFRGCRGIFPQGSYTYFSFVLRRDKRVAGRMRRARGNRKWKSSFSCINCEIFSDYCQLSGMSSGSDSWMI